MPIYEYKCENGHLFDVMQRMSEAPLTSCVECGAPVRKVLHPVNISFKGSGFYSTDYSNGSRSEKTETSSGNGDSGSPEKSAAKKSEPPSQSSSGNTAKKQD